jgi:hypothetical protein
MNMATGKQLIDAGIVLLTAEEIGEKTTSKSIGAVWDGLTANEKTKRLKAEVKARIEIEFGGRRTSKSALSGAAASWSDLLLALVRGTTPAASFSEKQTARRVTP